MTRKQAEIEAQKEANETGRRIYLQVEKCSPEDSYSLTETYRGNIETPSYCDPKKGN